MKKILIFLLIIPFQFFVSCTTVMQSKYSEPEREKLFAVYPKYRIDNKIQKICIIGNGSGVSEISSILTNIIIDRTNIKVVEPGNLQQILGGKIIEYGTGLTASESQAIAQMLQIDHIILFEEKVSPHRDYMYGGRAYNQINLKIVNTVTGEIILQTSGSFGFVYKDPRPYGYSDIGELSTSGIAVMRTESLDQILFQLLYAFGETKIGLIPANDPNQCLVLDVMIDSPVDRAGIQKGDRIVKINEVKISNPLEYLKYLDSLKPKQGDTLRFEIDRGGKILNVEVRLPVIPFRPEEPKERPEREKQLKQEKPI